MDAQAAFHLGLLNPAEHTPEGVSDCSGRSADKRYDVYRNNVTSSLVDALEAIFPAVAALVGQDNFRLMARAHVRATPPCNPLLHEYGHDFADHVEQFQPAQNLPFLADVARLERLWLDALNAADAQAFGHAELAEEAAGELATLRLRAHPATRLFRSRHPAADLFRNAREKAAKPVDGTKGSAVLITRPGFLVQLTDLPPGGYTFFNALFSGSTLGEAALAATQAVPLFDPAAAIAILIASGAAKTPTTQG